MFGKTFLKIAHFCVIAVIIVLIGITCFIVVDNLLGNQVKIEVPILQIYQDDGNHYCEIEYVYNGNRHQEQAVCPANANVGDVMVICIDKDSGDYAGQPMTFFEIVASNGLCGIVLFILYAVTLPDEILEEGDEKDGTRKTRKKKTNKRKSSKS